MNIKFVYHNKTEWKGKNTGTFILWIGVCSLRPRSTPPPLLSLTLWVRTRPRKCVGSAHAVCGAVHRRRGGVLSFCPSVPQRGQRCPWAHTAHAAAHTRAMGHTTERHTQHTHHGHTERHSSHGQQQSLSSFLLENRMKRGLCETLQCFLFLLCCWMDTCFSFILSFWWFHYQVFHSLQNTSNKQLIHLLKWQQYFICHFIFLFYFICYSLLWKEFEG